MNDKKREKLKKQLVEAGLMDQEDTLIEWLQTNYRGGLGRWKQGWGYFTEERFVCVAGFLNGGIAIPYKNIRELGKCNQGLIPMGITITYEDGETGELVTDRFSLGKREKWLDFLASRAGISRS